MAAAEDIPKGIFSRIWEEAGPRYWPLLVVLALCAGVIRYRWQLGYRDLSEFATDPFLWGVAIVGSLCAWIYKQRYGLPPPFAPGEVGILVVSIPGDERHAQQNSYVGAIRSLVNGDASLRDVVKVKPLSRELPSDAEEQHEEALRLGRRLGASFVIRPVLEAGGQRPWLSIVDQPEFSREEVQLGKVTTAQLAELDKLPLPQDVTLLARCALALSFYRRDRYTEAVEQFTQILEVPALPAASPERPHLNFLLGNSYAYRRSADPASILPLAIAAYDQALRGWTRERYPTDWAMTMNNRGNAYRELPGPDRAANLQEAIRCYEQAIAVWNEHGFTHYTAIARNNLDRARCLLDELTAGSR